MLVSVRERKIKRVVSRFKLNDMKYFPLLALVLAAGCATAPSSSSNDTYQQNLATAQAVLEAHSNADYDAWLSYHAEDAVIWGASYGSEKMTAPEAAELFATYHSVVEGISTAREVWLPGVDTLNLQADGSVRVYADWTSISKINGDTIDVRAYHFWNFDESGKITQAGNFFDASGLQAAIMAPAPEAETEEVAGE